MNLDHSVYPDLAEPPMELHTIEDRADYVHRICGAFDFGIFPEREDWQLFAGWKDVFDRFPLPDSPGYHTFRSRYRWEPVPRGTHGLPAHWKMADEREGRIDPCEDMV
ncbi:MAG TPA: hypothetical protein VMN36_00455 [Verrucomicrobiales bacterium]|nr:hypothetical protein [Verrucomicrobiales bacterium]